MVILDQSKPVSLYLKIKKFKNQKFVNCTFIIHKNGNKTSLGSVILVLTWISKYITWISKQ